MTALLETFASAAFVGALVLGPAAVEALVQRFPRRRPSFPPATSASDSTGEQR